MRHRKLTEAEWRALFFVRCKSKRGETITDDERALINRAFIVDVDRYSVMEADVFDATVPFGSSVRARR